MVEGSWGFSSVICCGIVEIIGFIYIRLALSPQGLFRGDLLSDRGAMLRKNLFSVRNPLRNFSKLVSQELDPTF